MSPRRRLGVALLLDPPWSTEVDGLRRALGDSSLGSVAPHLTLVPPVNVRSSDLGSALDIVRRAAAGEAGPFSLQLGPVATFVPTNPVVYLAVGGTSMASLRHLREAVLAGPLLRPDRWPWVPHVTLADQASPGQAEAALVALGHYQAEATLDRVVIMEERDRLWGPLCDTGLGPPAIVGRGGLDLEITAGRVIGPDVLGLLVSDSSAAPGDLDECVPARQAKPSIVLTGRRHGQVAGVGVAWQDGPVGARVQVCVFVEPGARAQGVGRALLVALETSARRRGWEMEGVRGYGPVGFYAASSAWIRDVHPSADLRALPRPS
jgi:2'-5' RNA ligase